MDFFLQKTPVTDRTGGDASAGAASDGGPCDSL